MLESNRAVFESNLCRDSNHESNRDLILPITGVFTELRNTWIARPFGSDSVSRLPTVILYVYLSCYPNWGVECKGIWKIAIFDKYLAISQKQYNIRPTVIMDCEQETVPKLSNATSINDLEWPLTKISCHDIRPIQCQITRKWYKIYLKWQTNRKSCLVYQTAPFSMTLNNSKPWV